MLYLQSIMYLKFLSDSGIGDSLYLSEFSTMENLWQSGVQNVGFV
jgi:hypothetical protein